jgi:hypothetical protein
MSFHPLKRGLRVFSSIHFIQIDIGYEFSSIEEEGYMFFPLHSNRYIGYEFSSIEKRVTSFFLHSLHPNRHRL